MHQSIFEQTRGPTLPKRRQFFKHGIPGIQLVDGGSSLEGRVEVYNDNQWGTVSPNSWEHADAAVVCTQLGFSGGFALEDLEFGGGSGNIWMNEVKCR